ncbi:hypothetical protein BH09MYX1_BH09MYX1_62410 [soil metagenome]
MTPTSLLPKIAAHAGIDYGTLCESILASAKLHAGLPAPEETSKRAASGTTEVVPLRRAAG